MIGVILAAGRGRRLSRDIDLDKIGPKCLLPVNGCTLLERMVADLASSDVDAVIIVAGYKRHVVLDACRALESRYGIEVRLAYNWDYARTNTAYSLDIGLADVDEDVVVFNGDMLYDYAILRELLDIRRTAIVVDNRKPLTNESFKLRVVDSRIEEMGKHVPIEEATGEFIGISKIAKIDLDRAKRLLKVLIADDLNNYYDFIYKSLSQDGSLAYSYTNGRPWTEIDDIHDYEYAECIAGMSDGTRGQLQ